MSDRVTAVGEIVRSHLSNGENTQTATNGNTYTGTVRIARAANCATLVANCLDLAVNRDSVVITSNPPVPPSLLTWVPGVGAAPGRWEMIRVAGNTVEPTWDATSRASYNSWMRNGETGARRLDLPIVDVTAGTTPIDLIRRPRAGDLDRPGHAVRRALLPPGERARPPVGHRGGNHRPADRHGDAAGGPVDPDGQRGLHRRCADRHERQRRRRPSAAEHAARYRVHQDRAPVAGGGVGRRDDARPEPRHRRAQPVERRPQHSGHEPVPGRAVPQRHHPYPAAS